MHRAIGPTSHGILDYCFAILIAIAPGVVGFSGRQARWCYIFAAIIVVLALLTRYPLGAFRQVGFISHGVIELLLGIVMLVLPWIAGFSAGVLSRNFYMAMGVLLIAIWALTDFRGVRSARPAAAPAPAAPQAPPPKP